MDWTPPPSDSGLDAYDALAAGLLAGLATGDPVALQAMRLLPRYRNPDIAWLDGGATDEAIRAAGHDLADTRLAIARACCFLSWEDLVAFVEAGEDVRRFERAVDAVVTGDLATLSRLLSDDPGLARARSSRVTCFDPPRHAATLLHYVAANGTEPWRQRTPQNVVDVAGALLQAGAEPDAAASFYGGSWTTMSLLVSSSPPADAGLQIALVELLADAGASVTHTGNVAENAWSTPLGVALTFGMLDAARALVRLGAGVDDLPAAAGLGDLERVIALLPAASAADRHAAVALAAQHGHVDIARLLLDAGEDPSRFNPRCHHHHSTPLHQAAIAGHGAMARLLVERGASLDVEDLIHRSKAAGWAEHGGHVALAAWLEAAGRR